MSNNVNGGFMAKEAFNKEVVDSNGEVIGRVVNIKISHTGYPFLIMANKKGFLGIKKELIAIPFDNISGVKHKVALNINKEELDWQNSLDSPVDPSDF